jgi:VWFA-related protein
VAATAAALRGFVDDLRRDDQVMVIGIGSDTEVLAPLTRDHSVAIAALMGLEPWGTTPLYDAALAAVDAIQEASGRRALILVSDGADRYSQTTANELVEHVRQRDVLLYPIAIAKSRPPVFAELATVTGGRSSFVPDLRDLPRTLQSIGNELRSQYLLGYAPPSARPGEWRSIDVTVNRPDVRVRARDGYRAR